MTTLKQEHSRDACYFGDRPEWLIVATVHRDSDTVERANWQSWIEALGGESETVAIERSSHWAVGWVDYLVVDPANQSTVTLAESLQERLENYPVLDEQALSNLEWDEYLDSWRDYGKRDFIRGLVARFNLSSQAEGLLDSTPAPDAASDPNREFYESLVTSGEYYRADGSGVALQVDYAVDRCSRERMAEHLRYLRAL